MTTQHTPAPWIIEEELGSTECWYPHGVLYAGPCIVGTENMHVTEEDRANAQLIAAAPDLLSTLKAILPYAENEVASLQELGRDDSDTMKEYEIASEILQSVYSAINKAEGK